MNKNTKHVGEAGRFRLFGRRGSATLEMAICGFLLLVITFGSIDFGYALYTKNQIVGAAREGARAAIVSGSTNADVTTAVANVLSVAQLKSAYTIVTKPPDVSTATSGTAIQVTVNYTWNNQLGLKNFSQIKGTTISAVATMRKE